MSKFDSFSKIGKYHLSNEIDNQDAFSTGSNDRFDAVVLADGVSSCKKGGEGAEITVETVKKIFLENGDIIMKSDIKESTWAVLSVLSKELEKRAAEDHEDVREYASTLAAVLIDRNTKTAFAMNLGDSMIMGIKGLDINIVGMPCDSKNGIPSTITKLSNHFTNAIMLNSKDGAFKYDAFVLCSDGAWREMFHKGILRNNVKEMMIKRDFNGLRKYLKEKNTFDDCTFIALDTERENEWDKDSISNDLER